MTKAVIFDLDGTLIDSAVVILGIINKMRVERGSDRVLMNDVRPHLSKGGLRLVRESLGEVCGDAQGDLQIFRDYYAVASQGKEILFDRVLHLLENLAVDGYRLGICTNKPQKLCDAALQQTGLRPYFKSVVSAGEVLPAKPDPIAYVKCCLELGVLPADTILVGDSEVDRDTAKAVGAQFVLVTYGYPIGAIDTIDAAEKCHMPVDILASVKRVFEASYEINLGE